MMNISTGIDDGHERLTDKIIPLLVVYPLDGDDVRLKQQKIGLLEKVDKVKSLTAYAAAKSPNQ